MKCIIALVLLVEGVVQATIFNDQCMHAVGRLVCHGHPTRAAHVYMKLKDVDDGPNGDDIMDIGHTSEQGQFHLYGCARDAFGVIDVTIDVKHNCSGRPQKIEITVPKSFVGKTYNTTIDLSQTLTNATYKIAAYPGKLQPTCDELHGHTHITSRKRRQQVQTQYGQSRPDQTRTQSGQYGQGQYGQGRYGQGHQSHSWQSPTRRNQQCMQAIGRLVCRDNSNLAKDVWIQLRDRDDAQHTSGSHSAVQATAMDTGYSTQEGNFHLFGCTEQVGRIDPVLVVRHKCGGGQSTLTIKVPAANVGGVYNATHDMRAPTAQYRVDNYVGRMPSMCDDLHSFGPQQANRGRFRV